MLFNMFRGKLMGLKFAAVWGVALLGSLALSACGNGGTAVETRQRSEVPGTAPVASMPAASLPEADVFSTPVEAPKAAGKLTGNRRETADAKAVRLFERNGHDFGSVSAEDYLAKAVAFSANPPRDAEKISRPNGDVLIYQASSNTFAVVDRRGVVRTMFKPSTGATYWQDQKARAPDFGR